MGKWCLHASSFIFDQIVIKVAGNHDRHKNSDEFDFGSLVSMAHLYVFEMRFDLGTLDSGERSLPFGLLVIIAIELNYLYTLTDGGGWGIHAPPGTCYCLLFFFGMLFKALHFQLCFGSERRLYSPIP